MNLVPPKNARPAAVKHVQIASSGGGSHGGVTSTNGDDPVYKTQDGQNFDFDTLLDGIQSFIQRGIPLGYQSCRRFLVPFQPNGPRPMTNNQWKSAVKFYDCMGSLDRRLIVLT